MKHAYYLLNNLKEALKSSEREFEFPQEANNSNIKLWFIEFVKINNKQFDKHIEIYPQYQTVSEKLSLDNMIKNQNTNNQIKQSFKI